MVAKLNAEKQTQVAEAAIRLYSQDGGQGSLFEDLSRALQMSQTDLLHWFPNFDSLLTFMAEHVRNQFRGLAEKSLESVTGSQAKITAYVNCTYDWLLDFPHHAKVWLYFFFLCSLNKEKRELNAGLIDIGHARITKLIEEGQAAGEFAKGNALAMAKAMQDSITSSLLSCLSEDRKQDFELAREATHAACRACLGLT